MDQDFYRDRAAVKYASTDNPENDAVIAKALKALSLSPGDRLLDFGCADGYFLKRLCAKAPGVEGYGVDIINHVAWSESPELKLQAAPLPLPFPDRYFDALFCSQVLEHLENAELAVAEFCRVLKPGARAWIATPNGYADMWPCFHRLQRHIDRMEGHIRHFTDREIRDLFSRHGFNVVKRRYEMFLGLYLYYRFVAYNPPVKRRLVGSIAPCMATPSNRPSTHKVLRAAIPLMFTMLRMLQAFDYCFSWCRGCQIIEIEAVRNDD